ncbi:MAG: diaminopimelate decarboxylase, partial [Chloroflexota bacterium]|nr:diaminopimelate decarboxylase [Chloroflexota bacterium]
LDNWNELERVTRLAREMSVKPAVLLRVAPDVQTDTHRYLQTGHASSKFGFPFGDDQAKGALLRILSEGQLQLMGLHAHSGTMLRETRPYQETLARLFELMRDVYAETHWWPEEMSPGGGWAIDTPDTPFIPPVEMLAKALQTSMEQEMSSPGIAPSTPRLIIEPGRSIIARAGVTIYRIGGQKRTPGGITYLFVDGGMGDNIRPALYGATYTAFAVEHAFTSLEGPVSLAGRYCESGDILIEHVNLPGMKEGDLIAVPMTGAYCLPMASNYNLVPRSAVVLVSEESVEVMEWRETYSDILSRYPAL